MKMDTINETKTTTCSVCLDAISPSINYVKTLCNHEFCFTCMIQHLHRYTTCPLCRRDIMKEAFTLEKEIFVKLDIACDDENVRYRREGRCYDVFVKICIIIVYYLYLNAINIAQN